MGRSAPCAKLHRRRHGVTNFRKTCPSRQCHTRAYKNLFSKDVGKLVFIPHYSRYQDRYGIYFGTAGATVTPPACPPPTGGSGGAGGSSASGGAAGDNPGSGGAALGGAPGLGGAGGGSAIGGASTAGSATGGAAVGTGGAPSAAWQAPHRAAGARRATTVLFVRDQQGPRRRPMVTRRLDGTGIRGAPSARQRRFASNEL
jgi:hypothetical protein